MNFARKPNSYGKSLFVKITAKAVINYIETVGIEMPITVGTVRYVLKQLLPKQTDTMPSSDATCIRLLKVIAELENKKYKLLWCQRKTASYAGYSRLALFRITKSSQTVMQVKDWVIFNNEQEAKKERAFVMLSNRNNKRGGG